MLSYKSSISNDSDSVASTIVRTCMDTVFLNTLVGHRQTKLAATIDHIEAQWD